MKVVFYFCYIISNYCSVIEFIMCFFMFIDGWYVIVGFYCINMAEIIWDDYEFIIWKGELKFCYVCI